MLSAKSQLARLDCCARITTVRSTATSAYKPHLPLISCPYTRAAPRPCSACPPSSSTRSCILPGPEDRGAGLPVERRDMLSFESLTQSAQSFIGASAGDYSYSRRDIQTRAMHQATRLQGNGVSGMRINVSRNAYQESQSTRSYRSIVRPWAW